MKQVRPTRGTTAQKGSHHRQGQGKVSAFTNNFFGFRWQLWQRRARPQREQLERLFSSEDAERLLLGSEGDHDTGVSGCNQEAASRRIEQEGRSVMRVPNIVQNNQDSFIAKMIPKAITCRLQRVVAVESIARGFRRFTDNGYQTARLLANAQPNNAVRKGRLGHFVMTKSLSKNCLTNSSHALHRRKRKLASLCIAYDHAPQHGEVGGTLDVVHWQ